MNGSRNLLLSLALNAALILALGWTVRPRSRPADNGTPVTAEPAVPDRPDAPRLTAPPAADPALIRLAAEPVDWNRFSTGDWHRFRDELAACGCPRPTIQNIIVPLIGRHFAREMSALADSASAHFWEWMCPPAKDRVKTVSDGMERIDSDRKKAIAEIFPEGWAEGADASRSAAPDERLDFVSADVAQQVRDAEENRNALIREARETQTDRQISDELIRQAKDTFRAELDRLLTPEELAEWTARSSGRATWVRNLRGIELSPAEMAEIARLDDPDESRSGTPAESAKVRERKIEDLLGPDRFAEYRRAQDPNYARLLDLSERTGLGQDEANRLWQFQEAMELRAKQVNSEAAGSVAERMTELAALRKHQEAEVRDSLAPVPGSFEAWQRQQEDWLKRTFSVPVANPLNEWLKDP